ncbi:phosphatase PAP2 family protein [Cognatilysobacter bugurensis]|uniref:undecaprenyl-diphosphate phosphatase n=1 Tax=Cognatilysobacter bugurensis TaxID=543356 RepID=A0A918SUX5_9GAMM|nr:phosphatase PAP2 family protein [Lysobacter bugurensis]GHA70121.1 phosphatidylglycerophosphatase B [Lysobacter bugurensis]
MQLPTPPEHAIRAAGVALWHSAHFAYGFLRRRGWRLVLLFVGLLLPMWGFSELADEIHDQEAIDFDEPILRYARAMASDALDPAILLITRLGFAHGVIPFDIALILALALRRWYREATFATIALAGSGLLNTAAKYSFARERPTLWESIAPEVTYSFPSGHAMGSATLACVLVLLAWRTRWRWPVLLATLAFTVAVGFSRVYLGVHYPSDILAGWAAASAWTAAVFLVAFRGRRRPWQHHGAA